MTTPSQPRGTIDGFYAPEQLEVLKQRPIPRHIAIIPDGNRRWAAQHSLSPLEGHHKGGQVVVETVRAALELGIKTLTLFTLSTENMHRPQQEVAGLMQLLEFSLGHYRDLALANGVRLDAIGDLSVLPAPVRSRLEALQAETRHLNGLTLVLAINYGGRDELVRVAQRLAADCEAGRLTSSAIDESHVVQALDTIAYGDPDLLIRTGSVSRISNFLLWQLSYAELHFSNIMWPDFNSEHLLQAVKDFQNSERRFGL